jgi:hypothetical protein
MEEARRTIAESCPECCRRVTADASAKGKELTGAPSRAACPPHADAPPPRKACRTWPWHAPALPGAWPNLHASTPWRDGRDGEVAGLAAQIRRRSCALWKGSPWEGLQAEKGRHRASLPLVRDRAAAWFASSWVVCCGWETGPECGTGCVMGSGCGRLGAAPGRETGVWPEDKTAGVN